MKKVIVTGRAGLSGSHFSQELANRDYHVVITDGLCTGNISKARTFGYNPKYNLEECLKETIRYIIS
jgi:nucleoside-diphosphate-sugar epimerase